MNTSGITKLLLCLVLVLFSSQSAPSQVRKIEKWDLRLGIGASNFLGELGGADQIGTNGIKDLEQALTMPSVSLSIMRTYSKNLTLRADLGWCSLSGDDRLTAEIFRRNRNLHFKSNIFSFEVIADINLLWRNPYKTALYGREWLMRKKRHKVRLYALVGAGIFYFNPKAKYQGQWYALHDLSTEGQGLPNGAKKYYRCSISIPVGVGVRYRLDRCWSLGVEFLGRKTFTDYIDDVSSVYYDNATIVASNELGYIAGYLANPALNVLPGIQDPAFVTSTGQQRGDPTDKDAYGTIQMTVYYKFLYRKATKPKF